MDVTNITLVNWILDPLGRARNDTGSSPDFGDQYQLATQVALGAAIIIALAILLALVWNIIKRRLPDANRSSSPRRSVDSVERLVQDRLRNRPPPYSTAEADKPPSYEESFNDPTTPIPTQTPATMAPFELPDWTRPPASPSGEGTTSHVSSSRMVSYENRAFEADLPPYSAERDVASSIPSISMNMNQLQVDAEIAATDSISIQSDMMIHL